MVKIEYSPNSRASCQSCRHKILYGQIRVCAKAALSYGGYGGRYGGATFINRYHHANCYTNRRDFNKLQGFYSLIEEDQKRFMTTAQIRERFGPEDKGKAEKTGSEAAAAAVGTPISATPTNGKDKHNALDLQGATTDDIGKEPSTERILKVTGLKYSTVTAVLGQKVELVREPENKYDANAVKVTNVAGQTIGHIKKEEASNLSHLLAKMEAEGKKTADCTIYTCGDGYTQKIRFSLVEKERPEEEKKMAATLPTCSSTTATTRSPANIKSPSKLLKIGQGDKKIAANISTAGPTPNRKIINPYVKKTECCSSNAKEVTP